MNCLKRNTKVETKVDEFKMNMESQLCEQSKQNEGKYRKLFREFVEESSAGGINKVFSSKPLLIRIIWAVLCLACYGAMAFLSYKLIEQYLQKPTATFVDVTFEKNMAFPAVTVCNLNKFRRSRLRKTLPNVDRVLTDFRRKSPKLDTSRKGWQDTDDRKNFFLHKMFAKSGMKTSNEIKASYVASVEVLENLILQKTVEYSEDKLKSAGHEFKKLVVDCRWMGVQCNDGYLRKYWKHIWNWKYGNCYTFNFGLDSNESDLAHLETTKAGPSYGLQLDLFIEQHEYIPELSQEAGVKVVIVDSKQHPFPFHEGMVVSPGSSTSIALRKEIIERVDQISNGSCIEDTTGKTSIYSKDGSLVYTVQSCLDTCLVNQQQAECNCTDPQYPVRQKICSSKEEYMCLSNVDVKFKTDVFGCIQKCPQRCRSVSYRTTISDAQMSTRYQEYARRKLNHSTDFRKFVKTNQNFQQDFLRVKIYFEELNLVRIHEQFSYSLSNLLADIGGQLGLWVGVSVIAFAELGDLLISLVMAAFSRQ